MRRLLALYHCNNKILISSSFHFHRSHVHGENLSQLDESKKDLIAQHVINTAPA